MGNKKKSYDDFNGVLQVVFVIIILWHASAFVKGAIGLLTPETSQCGNLAEIGSIHVLCLWQMLLAVLSIATVIFILQLRQWAVYLYFTLLVAGAAVVYMYTANVYSFVGCAVSCVVFRLLLMLSNKGISAWQLIFDDDMDDVME